MLSPLPEVVVQVHAPVYDYQGFIIMATNEGDCTHCSLNKDILGCSASSSDTVDAGLI